MEILLVLIGAVAVWLLWRILKVQAVRTEAEVQRTQIEAVKLVVDQAARELDQMKREFGTPEEAENENRLIEYYDQLARRFNADEEGVKVELGRSANKRWRKALVIESVERGIPCRFLEPGDYDEFVPQADFPGPVPTESSMFVCSSGCAKTLELTYMPPEAASCPFCGSPTKHILWKPEMHKKHLEEWEVADRAWRLWKKRSPKLAAAAETEERTRRAAEEAEDIAEFEAALAEFKADNR